MKPGLQQWDVPLALRAEHDIPVQQTDDLVEEKCMDARKPVERRCHHTPRFGVDKFLYAAVERLHHHGLVYLGAVCVERTGGEAGQDAWRGLVSVEVAMKKRGCIPCGNVGGESLHTRYDVVQDLLFIVEMPWLNLLLRESEFRASTVNGGKGCQGCHTHRCPCQPFSRMRSQLPRPRDWPVVPARPVQATDPLLV